METTRLSTKGQIILPKAIRDSRAWGPGTEFTVEETGEGILLRLRTSPIPKSKKSAAVYGQGANQRRRGRRTPPLTCKSCADMIVVDTNVLVRLLTGDEPKQAAAA
jgi:AbrB family looped-hinge helix DNA binding protein